jgi:two-component system cell cycle response regulator
MESPTKRVLLVGPEDNRREVLGRRLQAQGYVVECPPDATAGADLALRAPPAAVVADLWMPGISGVQLCRLLRAEPATADVPIILCGDHDEPRNRFWSERAGASAYVVKGHTGDVVRALARAIAASARQDDFFVQLSGGGVDIRDRIARHLDEALFESVIASELRALASATSFERLFDLFAQFMAQVTRYRWIALATSHPRRLAIHCHPAQREAAEREARTALGLDPSTPLVSVEDEDASADVAGADPIVHVVPFASEPIARFAIGPVSGGEYDAASLSTTVARELGAPIKIATLVEESEKLAATDALTGLMNRRAFKAAMTAELARSARHKYALSLVMLDVDHFKSINDRHGHAAGDRVLIEIGQLLASVPRRSDISGRWGGEEFVVAWTSTDREGARTVSERLRAAIEGLVIADDAGGRIPVTASFGLAQWRTGESLEVLVGRADRAMYESKTSGRNRVTTCSQDESDVRLAPSESARAARVA